MVKWLQTESFKLMPYTARLVSDRLYSARYRNTLRKPKGQFANWFLLLSLFSCHCKKHFECLEGELMRGKWYLPHKFQGGRQWLSSSLKNLLNRKHIKKQAGKKPFLKKIPRCNRSPKTYDHWFILTCYTVLRFYHTFILKLNV